MNVLAGVATFPQPVKLVPFIEQGLRGDFQNQLRVLQRGRFLSGGAFQRGVDGGPDGIEDGIEDVLRGEGAHADGVVAGGVFLVGGGDAGRAG